MIIDDGKGSGVKAKVTKDNRLAVTSISKSAQAHVSSSDKEAYQVLAEQAIGTSDVPVLFLENDHNSKILVVTFMRVESVGAAASNTAAYFSIYLGKVYASGGADLIPVNVNQSSGNLAQAICKDGSSSLTLTNGDLIDKNYTSNSMQAYNKDGSIVLNKGDSISIWHKGSTVAGQASVRISFYYIDEED